MHRQPLPSSAHDEASFAPGSSRLACPAGEPACGVVNTLMTVEESMTGLDLEAATANLSIALVPYRTPSLSSSSPPPQPTARPRSSKPDSQTGSSRAKFKSCAHQQPDT